MWTSDEILQYRELLSNATDTQREVIDAATDVVIDVKKKIDVRRKAEMIVVNTFQRLNDEMRTFYKELEKKMQRVLIEAESAFSDDIFCNIDVRGRATLEMYRLTHVLKEKIENM